MWNVVPNYMAGMPNMFKVYDKDNDQYLTKKEVSFTPFLVFLTYFVLLFTLKGFNDAREHILVCRESNKLIKCHASPRGTIKILSLRW